MKKNSTHIAVLVPCHNEAATIAQVILDFKQNLPEAHVVVGDNHSSDNTKDIAKEHGAQVISEKKLGKGHMVRRLFNQVEADIYVLIDGDNTYDVASVHKLINQLQEQQLDMIVGSRKPISCESFPTGHKWGNKLFSNCVAFLFGRQFNDIFSGFRVFSHRFIKSFPCLSHGFEIETEMTVHALEMQLPVDEIVTPYSNRPNGSDSKLKTFKDGFKILFSIIRLFKETRPFAFFSGLFIIFLTIATILFVPILLEFLSTGLVPRLPTTILVASLSTVGFTCFFSGLLLDSVSRARLQTKKLLYLNCSR